MSSQNLTRDATRLVISGLAVRVIDARVDKQSQRRGFRTARRWLSVGRALERCGSWFSFILPLLGLYSVSSQTLCNKRITITKLIENVYRYN